MSKNNYRNYKYYYSGDYAQSRSQNHINDRKNIGRSLNFAAREAYKQLRTNLDFALADVKGCRCIGITSSMRGDGKSLTSINLSYALAEDGYKVILLEGDMRIPTLGKKLDINQKNGLSSLLVNGDVIDSVSPLCMMECSTGYFDVITAGEIPPNPQELLGSSRMEELMAFLETVYDYVIVDLPPITAVADALVASKVLDGMLIIVRRNNTERGALAEAIRQLDFAGSKILGFVFNAANNEDAGYSRKYRYRYKYKSYRGYRSGYGYSDYGYRAEKPKEVSKDKIVD